MKLHDRRDEGFNGGGAALFRGDITGHGQLLADRVAGRKRTPVDRKLELSPRNPTGSSPVKWSTWHELELHST